MKDLAIIILNYNSFDDTSREVNKLLEQNCPETSIYIVDNDSRDKDKIMNFAIQKKVNYIISEKNGGYAYGNNLAIKQAIADKKKYFLLLNPDIDLDLATIEILYKDLEHKPEIGVIGPRICYRNNSNTIYSDGGLLYPEKGFMGGHTNFNTSHFEVQMPTYNDKIDYVDGSVLMFRKELLDEVGLMNEKFFMYYEESEWCLRIKRKTNWKLSVNTSVSAFNTYSDKGSFYEYYMTRNRFWLCRLYDGNTRFVKKERWRLAKESFKRKDFSLAKAYLKGILDGLYSKI
ncbi:glycosyltransferase family 2 protein [Chryseobacterium sp. JAH]|uniref:glycosyltransferase family 2 protein n=1 Tax=Chryseobacterium sp. JAH TaxID=1742858 RepID=UPI0006466BF5|nr:glycosyltransferase family 2 protein [Chryseobacterium sp. JAH]KUJ50508.1 glycosyl transferase [Chryseobacterium sp. JAH]